MLPTVRMILCSIWIPFFYQLVNNFAMDNDDLTMKTRFTWIIETQCGYMNFISVSLANTTKHRTLRVLFFVHFTFEIFFYSQNITKIDIDLNRGHASYSKHENFTFFLHNFNQKRIYKETKRKYTNRIKKKKPNTRSYLCAFNLTKQNLESWENKIINSRSECWL